MARPFFVVVAPSWLALPENQKHLSRGRVALGAVKTPLADKCSLFVRRRTQVGALSTEGETAHITVIGEESFVNSDELVDAVGECAPDAYLILYFEGTRAVSRCLVQWWADGEFADVDVDGTLRLAAYDLPPRSVSLVDSPAIVRAMRAFGNERDPDLFALQATRFLEGPHVLERLFDHLMELRAIKAPNFITVTKGLSDHLRDVMTRKDSPVRILSVPHSHLDLWASVQGSPMSFVDGGVARLAGYPGIEQFAMRVGTFRVIPGERDPNAREEWGMLSRVLADIADMSTTGSEQPDRKRLQEAIRYVLEALALMWELERPDPPVLAFLHGPLINQFVTYDELSPYNLPDVVPEFLSEFGFSESVVRSAVSDIPKRLDGSVQWNQWIPIYALIVKTIFESATPAVGVVERSVGTQVARSLLETLADRGAIKQARAKKIQELISEYGISDDLLFGCILEQGQYFSPPITIRKNPANRAHPKWEPVVRQYANPRATILKTQDGTFPLRIETNGAAAQSIERVASIAYHTARLLPRYAFPVGLDIVDKYAKVPDWMSRAVSTAGAAALMKRAMEHEDDPVFLTQVRRALAGQPRDFFYRPSVR